MLDNFITHSSMPVQKVVWAYEGTYDSSDPHWTEEDVGGLPYQHIKIPFANTLAPDSLLLDGIWTADDWQTAYTINTTGRVGGWFYDGGAWTLKTESLSAYLWDYTNISVHAYNDYGATMKFRVWAYLKESDWQSSTTDKTADELASLFQKDTRLAQLNMIAEIEHEIPNRTTWTYYHNLGFRPLVRVWMTAPFSDSMVAFTLADEYFNGVDDDITISQIVRNCTLKIDNEKIEIYSENPNSDTYNSTYLIRIYNYGASV